MSPHIHISQNVCMNALRTSKRFCYVSDLYSSKHSQTILKGTCLDQVSGWTGYTTHTYIHSKMWFLILFENWQINKEPVGDSSHAHFFELGGCSWVWFAVELADGSSCWTETQRTICLLPRKLLSLPHISVERWAHVSWNDLAFKPVWSK